MAAITLNKKKFGELMEQEGILLVNFWAPWCTYCRRISGAYDKVAQENQGKIVTGKINIDEEDDLARQENIEVIPTLVLYRDGKVLGSLVAPESKASIDAFLRENLSAV